jgi:hypothetical protein
MKKTLNTDSIANELREGSAFFREARQAKAPEQKGSPGLGQNKEVQKIEMPADHKPSLVDQSVSQSTDRPTNQSTDQLMGEVVDRPVAFYLPKIIHNKIDDAVRYLQQTRSKRIDRSAVVSAILGNPKNWEEETLDQLADKAINQLTNRLTSRLTS